MMKAKSAGTSEDRDDREGEAVEGLPEEGQRGDLVPVHEVGDARRRLDLRASGARRLQLEEHRHAVAAEAEENALAQAQDAAVAPAQHQAERDEGVGEVFADQVEAEMSSVSGKTTTSSTARMREADAVPTRLAICCVIVEHDAASRHVTGGP